MPEADRPLGQPLPPRQVVICQSSACRKQGAMKVLAAFRVQLIPGVAIVPGRCLGQCGHGPMVVILPEQVWYNQVHPDEVPAVIDRHLRGNCPIAPMLYRKFHPDGKAPEL